MSLDFHDLDPTSERYASDVVERLFNAAVAAGASDIHIEKKRDAVHLRWRINGVLMDLDACQDGTTASILGRIKALARLVTYRHDIPQEGRIALKDRSLEARVGTLPTLHGERAVIRLTSHQSLEWLPEQLGLEPAALDLLLRKIAGSSGVVLITGPAGAGKTTTAYACLRHLQQNSNRVRSLVSLEDPIESELQGVSQSQIDPTAGYSWSDGLNALLRQDPEVMLVGEIRDPQTAAVVFQAAMTGQLVLSTMHARSASDALRRLLDLQVPVHHLRSALDYLICQRLVPAAATPAQPNGGARSLVTELLPPIEGVLADAIQAEAGTAEIQRAAESLGMRPWQTATHLPSEP